MDSLLPVFIDLPEKSQVSALSNQRCKFLDVGIFFSHRCSLLHLMLAIACTHASTRATSLMHVKNSMHHLGL